MYETMEVHPFNWLYYLSFIFLTTFAFLNIVIGIVVNVMENEHAAEEKQKNLERGVPTISDLQLDIRELKQLIIANSSSPEAPALSSRVK